LGAVLDEEEPVLFGDGGQFIDPRGLTKKMNGNDALGLRRDGRFNLGWIEIEGALLDVDKARARTDVADTPDRRDKGERRRDDFVAAMCRGEVPLLSASARG
jgi:hypothetical protein